MLLAILSSWYEWMNSLLIAEHMHESLFAISMPLNQSRLPEPAEGEKPLIKFWKNKSIVLKLDYMYIGGFFLHQLELHCVLKAVVVTAALYRNAPIFPKARRI